MNLVFSALSDPTRRAILVQLAKGDASVAELAKPFGMRQPSISKHLRVLEQAGLISSGQDAQRRPRSLVVGGPLKDVDEWLARFREQWERPLRPARVVPSNQAKAEQVKGRSGDRGERARSSIL